MRRFLFIVRNFTIVNVLFVVPACWLIVCQLPDRIEIKLTSDSAMSCTLTENNEVIRGTLIKKSDDIQTIWFNLPRDVNWHDVSLRFSREGKIGVSSLSLISHQVFRSKFTPSVLAEALDFLGVGEISSNSDVLVIPILQDGATMKFRTQVGFVDGKLEIRNHALGAAIIGGELLLLLISFLCAKHGVNQVGREELLDNVIVAAAVSIFFCCILPVQSFLVNRSMFEFPFRDIVGEALFRSGVVFIYLLVMLQVFSWVLCKRLFAAMLVSIMACGYLETGVLAIGLPSLNGDMKFFANITRATVDTCVLAAAFVLTFMLCRVGGLRLRLTVAAIVILSAASMFDLKVEHVADKSGGIVTDFTAKNDIAKSVTYSGGRNVLVFVLDAMQADAAHDSMERSPHLKAHFQGFTEYVDNIGMHHHTLLGVAGLMTGKYLCDAEHQSEYIYSIFTEQSVLKDALDSRMNVFFMPGSFDFGYTNMKLPATSVTVSTSSKSHPFSCRAHNQMPWSLDEVVLFRCTPFALKRKCMASITEGWHGGRNELSEAFVFPILADGKVSTEAYPAFMYSHTDGIHWPIRYRRNGEMINGSDDSYNGMVEQGQFVLSQLAAVFDKYRERGIYDNSTIIVTADHGWAFTERKPAGNPPIPPQAWPCLWIKPEHATNAFTTSHVPTSHAKIATVLRTLFKRPLSGSEMEQMLFEEKRLFRRDANGHFEDWTITSDGAITYTNSLGCVLSK